ncbi:unnamed protein product [Adineta steineri]|uniref:Type VII secretion system protein EssD-like domain-containing protein n=1 Tax=Adineta steineri TaxID=433720 RepID=A0A815PSS9_9BILA|nr:unnamed protein product [Adineta steineri]CAF3506025.1 unnamed protein product [Adineta steineri]
MNILKLIPFVGTTISAVQCVDSVVQGDYERAASRLGETVINGFFDATIVFSGGIAALLTSPANAAGKAAWEVTGKAALQAAWEVTGKAALQAAEREAAKAAWKVAEEAAFKTTGELVVRLSATATRALVGRKLDVAASKTKGKSKASPKYYKDIYYSSTNGSGIGGAGEDDERDYNGEKEQGEHERDEVEVRDEPDNPIEQYFLGLGGRVESVYAKVHYQNLRVGSRYGCRYTQDIKGFVHSLAGFRQGTDEVGHIIGDALGGPTNRRYNFFPQCSGGNKAYWHTVEKRIRDFLKQENERRNSSAYVKIRVELFYDAENMNRPTYFMYVWEYSDGSSGYLTFSNLPK